MSHARVSVVIPCFNYETYVGSAVRSALSQRDVDVEVIVVDDASTDRSAEVVQALAAGDPRVTLVRRRANGGPVATFNEGLAAATGEFLVRLDADDLLTPGSLERSVDVATRFPRVVLVYGHPVHFVGSPPAARYARAGVVVWTGTQWLTDRCRTGVNVITSPEVLMRMSAVRAVGGQRDLAHTHDMEMWLRLATVGDVAYLRGVDQAWHREHTRSLSRSAEHPLGLTIFEERRAAFELALSDVAPELLAVARRSLATEAVRRASHEYDRGRAPRRSVDGLLAFALETDAGIVGTAAWRGLVARRGAGELWIRRRPWAAGLPVLRLLGWRLRHYRWSRTGLYNGLRPARVVRRLGL